MDDESIFNMNQEAIRDMEASISLDDRYKYKDSDSDMITTVCVPFLLVRWGPTVPE